jgi:hypothetical protein
VVIVREIDSTLTEEDVRDTFERIFPGKVVAVRKAFRTSTLFDLLEELRPGFVCLIGFVDSCSFKEREDWPQAGAGRG